MNASTISTRNEGLGGTERFPLVRYFSLTALAVLLAIAVGLVLFNQRQAHESLDQLAESQNVTLSKTFGNFLWGYFAPLVEESRGRDAEALKADPRLAYLRRIAVDTMRDTGAVKVSLYNLDGTTVFSTNRAQIGENRRGQAGFRTAAGGDVASGLTHVDRVEALEGAITNRDLYASYLPLRDDMGHVVAVLELHRDVTALVRHMEQSGLIVACYMALAMLALYGLLTLTFRRAQAIIDHQADALRNSLHQVEEANRLLDQRVRERTAELSTLNEAMAIEIKERRSAEERLEYLAHHDPLTGLPNRFRLQERIEQAVARAKRAQGRFAILFIDLDNFKDVNDRFGHPAGDGLLREVAGELAQNLRGSDTLARLGGDEFILLAEIEGEDNVGSLADKVLEIIHRPRHVADEEFRLTASIGISLYPDNGEDGDTLVRNADAAMFRAKARARGQYVHCSPAMIAGADEPLSLDAELRRAMDNGELRLMYQLQLDPRSSEITGCEALLRWRHPTQGEIPPARFIPVAEDSGLIRQLGEWVLREACQEMRRWQDCGFNMPRVAVNMSARQLEQDDIVERVLAILEETGLAAGRLELEITETAIMQHDRITELLGRLRDGGVSLVIDDFGTGYSSLDHLKHLPIHKLKIDRSFVMNLHHDSSDRSVIRAIISLARSMRLATLASGVESHEQADILIREGCDQAQGFLYSKPLAGNDLILLWAELGQGSAIREVNALFRL